MFYQITEQKIQEINYEQIHSDGIILGLINLEELSKIYDDMGFDDITFEHCKMKTSTFQNSSLIYSNYTFGMLHILDVETIEQVHSKFAFYLMKNLLLIVDLYSPNHCIEQAFQTTLQRSQTSKNLTLPWLFTSFLFNFLSKDNQSLELFEIKLETLEKQVLSSRTNHIRTEIFHYRRELLILKNYYEQFITIADEIIQNTNQLFEFEQLIPLNHYQSRILRLSGHTKELSEYVSEIKDSYMAQLDINLNSTMKLFTIVTSIFMPLTLIVGWYGMNFKYMPELSWKYGYLWVIGLCILVFLLCIFWFKKKRFF